MATEQGYKYYSKEEIDEQFAAKVLDDFTYSTTEKACGKWIDDETIYKKTIDLGSLPNATAKTVNHGISNIGQVVKIEGIATNGERSFALPVVYEEGSAAFNTAIEVRNSDVRIVSARDQSDLTAYITIYYTKEEAA